MSILDSAVVGTVFNRGQSVFSVFIVQYILLDCFDSDVFLPPVCVSVFKGIKECCGKNAKMHCFKLGSPVLIHLCGGQMRCWQFV